MMNLLKNLFGGGSKLDPEILRNAVIVDVRTPAEFTGGHATGAVNIPLDQLEAKLARIQAYKKPIVLCCASGMRSARAKALLSSRGIDNLHDAGSWHNLA